MNKTCSVIGWVLDAEHTKIIVREASGRVFSQPNSPEGDLGPNSVQTGAFRRSKRIVDPQTRELIGYEMERITEPFVVGS